MTTQTEIWYRYDDVMRSQMSYDDTFSSRMVIEVSQYTVIRRTPKGVWLVLGVPSEMHLEVDQIKYTINNGLARFVLVCAHRRFACPTRAQAMESFKARKQKQIKIYKARVSRAEQALNMAEWMETE